MFAARNPLKRPLLLGGLRVLCVRKNLQPRRAMSSCVTKCSRLFSSLFLQEDENISPILPISSALSKKEHFGNCPRINRMRTLLQNTGGGTALATHSAQSLPFFPTANKCATRTNSRNLNRLMRLLHDFWIPGGVGVILRQVCWPYSDFRVSIFDFFKIANAKSPAHSSDAPSPRPSAATPTNSPSTRNTTSPDGPHHRSTSVAGCASTPRPARSSSLGPAAKISAQTSGRSKQAAANSTPPQNQSGTDRAAPASPSPGSKTTASRCGFLPSAYSAKQNQSSSSPVRPYIFSTYGTARCLNSAYADSSEIRSESARTFFPSRECCAGSASTTTDAQTAHALDPSTQ